MRLASIIFAVGVASLALADTKSDIQSQYDRFAKAYVKNDVSTMLSIVSPNYTLVNEEKKLITLAEYKVQLEKRRKAGKKNKAYTVTILSLKQRGNEVSVETMETITTGPGTTKKHHYLDGWVRTEAGWRLISTETIAHH
ncbi:MAG TPA: nuclear transport factor 2 family protein [Fimbriimonas sp.]|nr:nuclear transport factor 2 family protein [Fimbriimonas sp.]